MTINQDKRLSSALINQKGQDVMPTTMRILILFALLAMLALVPGAPLLAAPQLPSSFYGIVTVDGVNVAAGTVVTAWINGVQYAQVATFTAQGNSVYTLDVRGDDPETPGIVEGGVAGNTIVFKVGGQVVAQTGTWQTGSNVALNLSYTSPAAVSITFPVDRILPINSQGSIPILLPNSVSGLAIYAFSGVITFDPAVVQFAGVDKSATLSSGWTISHNATEGQVQIAAYGTSPLSGSGPLLNLLFNTSNNGGARSDLIFTSFKFNEGTPATQAANGSVTLGSLNISGRIGYTPTDHPVSSTSLDATGTSTEATTSGSDGSYTLGIKAVGNYTVTPSKSGDLRDSVSGLDASYILQSVVGARTFNEYQTTVADVSQFDGVTAYDAALIAIYLVDIQNPPSLAGQWDFSPVSRNYAPLNGDVADQNYTAVLYGDVTENWGPVVARARNDGATIPTIHLPDMSGKPGEVVRIAVQMDGVETADIYAIELDLAYDDTVVTFRQTASAAQLDSSWQVVANGSENRVSLVAFSATPLPTSGDVLYLDFEVIGQAGDETALTPERFRINEEQPTAPVEAAGKIVVPSNGTNGNAIFLPFVNGSSSE